MSIQDPLTILPKDCALHVLTFLSAQDLTHRVNLVCKKWRDYSNEDYVWKARCLKDHNERFKHYASETWKETWRQTPARHQARSESFFYMLRAQGLGPSI